MSKQLAISAVFSVFAMASFVLFATDGSASLHDHSVTGAEAFASAPALDRLLPGYSVIVR